MRLGSFEHTKPFHHFGMRPHSWGAAQRRLQEALKFALSGLDKRNSSGLFRIYDRALDAAFGAAGPSSDTITDSNQFRAAVAS
jgi:hypothetical protein